jgi:malonyl-CoA O-methyltransferase
MNIRDAYDAWAAAYDTDHNLTRDLDAVVTREVLAGSAGAKMLEIGCGTGKNTAWLAGIARCMLALDFSAGMLRQAQARLRTVGASNVALALADLAHPWPCASEWADLVVSNLVLEHIEDLAPVFAEARRVLVAQGRLFICELHPFRQYEGKRAVFERDEARVEIPAYVHHVSDFLDAAEREGFALHSLVEWRHDEDRNELPRLVSFLFAK